MPLTCMQVFMHCLFFFLKVKQHESLNVLHKFPIITIIIIWARVVCNLDWTKKKKGKKKRPGSEQNAFYFKPLSLH